MNAELSYGIFSAPDISNILMLPSYKVRRWIKNYWDERFASQQKDDYSWGNGREKAVNFLTFIEIYIFIQLRYLGLSHKKILLAHNQISEALKVKHPFATTKILAREKDIFYYFDNETIVKADHSKQIGFKSIIEHSYKKIDFNQDEIAKRFWPIGKENSVVVDPKHQFGQPVIEGTNILTETIYGYYKGGESIEFIASIFEINIKQVQDSIKYYKRVAA